MPDNPLAKYMTSNVSSNPLSKYMIKERPDMEQLTAEADKANIAARPENMAGSQYNIFEPAKIQNIPIVGETTMPVIPKSPLDFAKQGLLSGVSASIPGGEMALRKPELASTVASAVEGGVGLANLPKTITSGLSGMIERKAMNESSKLDKFIEPAVAKVEQTIKTVPEHLTAHAKKIGVRKEALDLIKKHGYDVVNNPEYMDDLAEQAYKSAFAKKTTQFGNKINTRKTIDEMGKILKDNKTSTSPVYKKLQEIYDIYSKKIPSKGGYYAEGAKVPTSTELGRQFKGEKLHDIAEELRLTRKEWSNLREDLSALYKFGKKEGYSNTDVFKVIDKLYGDAEKSGLKGINEARKLQREAYDIYKYQKDLSKLEKIDRSRIGTDFRAVVSEPTKRKEMIDRYYPYLGDEAKNLFNKAAYENTKSKVIKTAKNVGLLGLAGVGAGKATSVLRGLGQ